MDSNYINALLGILLSAVLTENYILVKFYGICPFMGVSKNIDTALGMGMAVTFVMALASAACWAVNLLLIALNLQYMQTVAFILVIASIVQVVEMFLKKSVPALYKALGVFLPMITTNCAVLGVALVTVQAGYDFLQSVINGAAGGTVDDTLQEIIACLHSHQRHAQHGAVGGDHGQEHAQSLIKGGDALFQEHFHHLHDGGDDQNEGHGLHILQIQSDQQQIHGPAGSGSQRHDEGDRHAHAQGGVDVFGNAHEGADAVEFDQNIVFRQHGAEKDAKQRVNIVAVHYFAPSFFLFSILRSSHWKPATANPMVRKPPTGITICMAG